METSYGQSGFYSITLSDIADRGFLTQHLYCLRSLFQILPNHTSPPASMFCCLVALAERVNTPHLMRYILPNDIRDLNVWNLCNV